MGSRKRIGGSKVNFVEKERSNIMPSVACYAEQLKNKIASHDAHVCIVGLGYVGLPLAIAFAKKGFIVTGFDTNPAHIERLKKGDRYIVDADPAEAHALMRKKLFIPSGDPRVIHDNDVIIICVPTPLRKVKTPDISYVVHAAHTIKKYLRPGHLIILESTSYPTTTREVVLPILQETGLSTESDFFLCFSPERVNPADKNFPLTKIPKVVGGLTPQSTELARLLYSRIIKKVFCVSSPEIAETAKLLENTFRLVNIALVNEYALICHAMGIDIWEVIKAAKTKPFGFMPFYPGPGLGGHCIPVDPLFLSWKAKKLGFQTKMIDLASHVNRYMPHFVARRTEEIIASRGGSIKKARILIVGVTYKKDVKDLRESPALDVIHILQQKGARVAFHDPLIPYLKIGGINLKTVPLNKKNIESFDCVVLITDHSGVNYMFVQKSARVIFDTRNVYKAKHKNVISL
ncbi:MAG: nucleotide sugar dehydrogenase [Candidatus Omnitrophota bacterium]